MMPTRRQAMLLAANTLIGYFMVATLLAQQPPPDVIYINGNIYTLDAARPRAAALAVAGDRIVAVGSAREVMRLRQPATRTFDLHGNTVLPGLIDAHCHPASLGSYALGRIDLSTARSLDELVEMVAARVKQTAKGKWVIGGETVLKRN